MDKHEFVPRPLSGRERDLLLWVLPEGRAGYREYREAVHTWPVAAQGRRGEGNFILASPHVRVDVVSPLPPVIANGVYEEANSATSVAVRERIDEQIEFEIISVGVRSGRSWKISAWMPGETCPQCLRVVREVEIRTADVLKAVLAICGADERIWVYDCATQMDHPIPHTNFFTELMLVKNIRDPKIALDFHGLFRELSVHTNVDLAKAFVHYNQFKPRVNVGRDILPPPRTSWFSKMIRQFSSSV